MVVGGTGSWGSELVRQLIEYYPPSEIRVFSRGEHKQVEMRQKYRDTAILRFVVGDVRDAQTIDMAMHGIDVVFNLAALKHVPVCEENVWEAIQTNIHGAHNIVTAALKHDVEAMVQVSTDKAVDPLNLYGFTKGCAEKLVTSANYSPGKSEKTRFVCVRGGNVLSTTGSVVPLFKHLIRKHNKVTITSPEMSRFLMRLEEAIKLVLKATLESIGGEIFVMKMPGTKVIDLAHVMIEQIGNKKTQIENIGVRPGEKLYEVLVSKNEAPRTVDDGDYYVILPDNSFESFKKGVYKNYKSLELEEYNSRNTRQLNRKGILKLLELDNWLSDTYSSTYDAIFSPLKEDE